MSIRMKSWTIVFSGLWPNCFRIDCKSGSQNEGEGGGQSTERFPLYKTLIICKSFLLFCFWMLNWTLSIHNFKTITLYHSHTHTHNSNFSPLSWSYETISVTLSLFHEFDNTSIDIFSFRRSLFYFQVWKQIKSLKRLPDIICKVDHLYRHVNTARSATAEH